MARVTITKERLDELLKTEVIFLKYRHSFHHIELVERLGMTPKEYELITLEMRRELSELKMKGAF